MSYLLPLGPFHPALRTPLRIALHAEGETIVEIEYRDGYSGREIADRVRRSDPARACELIGRICGAHAFHHMLAWTLALEDSVGVPAPPRAQALRTAVAELERAASHLQQVAIVFELLGLATVRRELAALREAVLGSSSAVTGSRLAGQYALPLGVASDLADATRREELGSLQHAADALFKLTERTIRRRDFARRVLGAGALTRSAAIELGLAGVAARAAGVPDDVRVDRPYCLYGDHKPTPLTQPGGDVYARLMLLLLEAYESLGLARLLLDELPSGQCIGEQVELLPAGSGEAEVEGPAFPLRYRVLSDGTRARELEIDARGAPGRLAWRAMLAGSLVDDAAIIVASANTCTACDEV